MLMVSALYFIQIIAIKIYCYLCLQKHQLEGRKQGLEDEIRKFKRELKEDMFKDADQKYRDKMIALRVWQ